MHGSTKGTFSQKKYNTRRNPLVHFHLLISFVTSTRQRCINRHLQLTKKHHDAPTQPRVESDIADQAASAPKDLALAVTRHHPYHLPRFQASLSILVSHLELALDGSRPAWHGPISLKGSARPKGKTAPATTNSLSGLETTPRADSHYSSCQTHPLLPCKQSQTKKRSKKKSKSESKVKKMAGTTATSLAAGSSVDRCW